MRSEYNEFNHFMWQNPYAKPTDTIQYVRDERVGVTRAHDVTRVGGVFSVGSNTRAESSGFKNRLWSKLVVGDFVFITSSEGDFFLDILCYKHLLYVC